MATKNKSQNQPDLHELVVIFKDDAQIETSKNTFRTAKSTAIGTLNTSIKRLKSKVQPIFNPKIALNDMPTEFKSFARSTRLNPASFFTVQSESNLEGLLDEFLKDPLVEGAYIKPPAEDPNSAWKSPDFTGNQGYLDAAPGGVDAKFSWKLVGGRGNGIGVVDVEQGFNLTHEDLRAKISSILGGNNVTSSRNHGTAVLGVIAGAESSIGVTGISSDVQLRAISHNGQGTAQAIINAANASKAGDIILLEVHRAGPAFNFQGRDDQRGYIAIEWWPDDFAAVTYATAKGIIVVEAAGNGMENFDLEIYNKRPSGWPNSWKNPFNPSNPQSGAIIVGAGASPSSSMDRSILSFSNWGKRVDVQGWGHNVATTGYGNMQGDKFVCLNPANNWTVEAGYPKSPIGAGPGFLSAMGNGISASFWCDHNQKVYFFKKDEYYRVDPNNGWTVEPDYPKPIAGNWPGMPADFANGIDAALWSDTNKRIYFFKGNQYVKINPSVSWNVEAGYPKPISGNWPGFPASFASGVDAAIYSYVNNKIYFFKGNKYLRINPSVSWNMEAGYPKTISSSWRNMPSEFNRGVDSALWDKTTDKVFFLKTEDLWYTSSFSGTSSASPVVTGSVACIQGRLKARGKSLLTSDGMRNLLRNTGSPQQRLSGSNESNADSNWRGINASFGSGFDASLWNGKSNNIYFFKGNQYAKVDPANNWNIEPGYPKPIEDNWPGMPSSFLSGINAALWSETNKKVYMFKGNEFIRIDPFNGWNVEPGYPKPIAGSWPGFPASFTSGVNAALYSKTNGKIYFFKGSEYIRINPSVSWNVEAGYPKPIAGNWPGMPADFASGLDAATWSGTNNKIYFFKGEKYVRISPQTSWDVESGYPQIIARQRIGNRPNLKQVFQNLNLDSNWPGFPQSFGQDLDASLWSDPNKKVYFFKGSQYIKVDPFNDWEMESGYPKSISSGWPGFPSTFASGVDAAIWTKTNDRIYFFKGSQYIKVNPASGWAVEPGYPKQIAGNWPGLPASFSSGIEAALWSGTNNKIYFFKGNQYVRIDPLNGWNMDSGYPKNINSAWKGMPSTFNSGINAALWNGKSSNIYFFKGSQYLKILPNNNWTMEKGYPREIRS